MNDLEQGRIVTDHEPVPSGVCVSCHTHIWSDQSSLVDNRGFTHLFCPYEGVTNIITLNRVYQKLIDRIKRYNYRVRVTEKWKLPRNLPTIVEETREV